MTSPPLPAVIQQCSFDPTDARELTFLGLVDLELLPAAETEATRSIRWLAAIQSLKSKEDLSGLAPEGCFISAEAVERVVGQISET